MVQTVIVAFREFAELLLIAGALVSAVRTARRDDLVVRIAQGIAAGAVLGAACAASYLALPQTSGLDGVLILVVGVATLVAVGRVFASQRSVRRQASATLDDWLDSPMAPLLVGACAAFFTWREVVEATFLLRESWDVLEPDAFALGVLVALALACLSAFAYRHVAMRIGLVNAFRVSSLVLAYLAAELCVAGLTKLFGGNAALAPFLEGGRYDTLTMVVLVSVPVMHWSLVAWRDTSRASARAT